MALFTPTESPAVVVKEVDLTGGVPNVQSTTGAIVGNFRWGPVLQRTPIATEAELVDTFAAPSDSNGQSIDFLSATQYLRYSSSLQVVRNIDTAAKTAFSVSIKTGTSEPTVEDSASADFVNPLILNKDNFDTRQSSLEGNLISDDSNAYSDLYQIGFAARCPGDLGNSIQVSYITAGGTADSDFNAWTYKDNFDRKPSTTIAGVDLNFTNDEMHLVVVDQDGLISGSRGTVLETFPNLSIVKDAKSNTGETIFAKEVINQQSEYIYMLNFDDSAEAKGAGLNHVDGKNYTLNAVVPKVKTVSLSRGVSSGALGVADYQEGFDLFEDKDQVEVDFLISPSLDSRTDQTTMVNDLTATARSTRKDCVAVASPARNDIIGVTNDATKNTNVITTNDTFTNSSYLVTDNNMLKVYDKFNDKYVFIPSASTVAGIMAATDYNRAAWFSPAGARRGQLLGVTALAYSPTKAQRDALYRANVNPIANIPGQGVLLFGDKTNLGFSSAFDRINVRRLFLVLERAIGKAAEQVMFEFNDEFTRAEFVNIVEPVLREVQGRRGITDFRVVCDETNNTAAVVDRNEFKADIFIKPARSINFVTLNFVAVRTGVDFEEVAGTV